MATETVKFRYFDNDDREYLASAEVTTELEEGKKTHAVTLLQAWDMGVEEGESYKEVFPYEWKGGDERKKMIALENAAIVAVYESPSTPITLPYEWDKIEVLDTQTEYTIKVNAVVPDINDDEQALFYKLKTIRRIKHQGNTGVYKVYAVGGIQDVQRELADIRIF